jgi:hypothetical protein
MSYTLDTLHPNRLRCDHGGHLIGPVDVVGEHPRHWGISSRTG